MTKLLVLLVAASMMIILQESLVTAVETKCFYIRSRCKIDPNAVFQLKGSSQNNYVFGLHDKCEVDLQAKENIPTLADRRGMRLVDFAKKTYCCTSNLKFCSVADKIDLDVMMLAKAVVIDDRVDAKMMFEKRDELKKVTDSLKKRNLQLGWTLLDGDNFVRWMANEIDAELSKDSNTITKFKLERASEEFTHAATCSASLEKLNTAALQAEAVTTITDQMIQSTFVITAETGTDYFSLKKTLSRILTKLLLVAARNDKKPEQIMNLVNSLNEKKGSWFSDVYGEENKEKQAEALVAKIAQSKAPCHLYDFLLNQEIDRMSKNTLINDVTKDALDVGMKALSAVVSVTVMGVTSGLASPAVGAAAGAISTAVTAAMVAGADWVLTYDNKIKALRRQIKGEWISSFRSGLIKKVDDSSGYASTGECAGAMAIMARHIIDYLYQQRSPQVQEVLKNCEFESNGIINTLDKYNPVMNALSLVMKKGEYVKKEVQGNLLSLLDTMVDKGAEASKAVNDLFDKIGTDADMNELKTGLKEVKTSLKIKDSN